MKKAKKTTGQKVLSGIGITLGILCALFVVYVIACAFVGWFNPDLGFADAFTRFFGVIPEKAVEATVDEAEAATEAILTIA